MDEGQDTSKAYEVGYGKPPKHTQWQKGQSGNPSGKRRKEESLREKLRRLAGEEVVVHQNGAPVSMTRDEAMLTTAFMKAMKGDLGCIKFIAEYLGQDVVPASVAEFPVTEADLAVIETAAEWRELLERGRAEMNADNDDRPPEGDDHDDDAPENF